MYGTILVVDDNDDVRETTRMILSRQGYEVWPAPDGNSAIQLMNQPVLANEVCTVVCDLIMKNGDGTDLIAYLRKYHPTVPIVICSGADDTAFLQGVLQDGVCDWMRKPVSRETLVQKVRTAIHLFTLRKQQDRYQESAQTPVSSQAEVFRSEMESGQTCRNRSAEG